MPTIEVKVPTEIKDKAKQTLKEVADRFLGEDFSVTINIKPSPKKE